MILNLKRFIQRRQPLWREYEDCLKQMEQEPGGRLELPQAQRLQYLHEVVAADLTQVRTFASEPETVSYLEGLIARGYGEIHQNPGRNPLRVSLRWFFNEFPQTVRRHLNELWLATLIMLLGALIGAGALLLDPAAKAIIMPFPHLLGDPSERVAEEEAVTADRLEGAQASFSAYLMTHNIRVSLLSLGLGLAFGVPTAFLVFYNGAILGAVAADYIRAGETEFLLGWLLPHGSVEIPALLLGAQAGLVLARALVFRQGRLSLKARMQRVAPDVVTLAGGLALLLVWAGLIESFFSQYHAPVIPYFVKIAFGTVQFALLLIFIFGLPKTTLPRHA